MKSTKTILAAAIVIAGFASFGCGSDVAGGVSLADAYEECNLLEMISEGEPLSESAFNVGLIQAEAFRDDGGSQTSYINQKLTLCNDNEIEPIEAAREQCVVCFIAIAAVVWN